MREECDPNASTQESTKRTIGSDETPEYLSDKYTRLTQPYTSLPTAYLQHVSSPKTRSNGITSVPSYTFQSVSGDFILVDFNNKAVEITEGQIVPLIGKTARELNSHLPEVLNDLKQCFIERSSIKREVRCRFNNIGSSRNWMITSSFVLPDLVLVQTEDIPQHENNDSNAVSETDERTLRLTNELSSLRSLSEMVNESEDLDEILNRALEIVSEITGVKVGGVYLLDKEMKNLDVRVVRGLDSETAKVISPVQIGKGVSGRVIQSGEPLFIESLPDSIELIGSRALRLVIEEQLKAAMCIPLKARGRLLGVMYVMTSGDCTLTPTDKELLITISSQISTAIDASHMYEQLSQSRNADELDRLRMAFLASVSHELRTPLTAIKGFASTLLQEDVQWDADMQTEFIRHIDQESNRLMRIVNDILDMSRLSCGVLRLDKSMILFDEVLGGIVPRLGELTKKHRLKLLKPNVSPLMLVDAARIGQVITNLVENAADYSPQGSQIILQAKVNDGNLLCTVADQGNGIPKEFREKIFDQFFRLEDGIQRRNNGSGLGLSICKGIVKGHGGQIWVDGGESSRGSNFTFRLPIMSDSEL